MLLEASLFLCLTLLPPLCFALQATPNSDCASVCIDSPSYNASFPSSFNTFTSDLTCSDNDYSSTASGQKFEACNSCLRSSTAVSGDLSDQGALLHNLRVTVDFCIWGFQNASSTVSSPCDIDYACDPLKGALESSYSAITISDQYAYCSTANGSFLSPSLSPCIQCYQASKTQSYLANFLIALEAACQQRPTPGRTLEIEGYIFSRTQVNITSSTTPTATPSASSKASTALSIGAVIGIIVGCLVPLLVLCGVGFVWHRKRRHFTQLRSGGMDSKRNSRFGEPDITMPVMGLFRARRAQRGRQDSEGTLVGDKPQPVDAVPDTNLGKLDHPSYPPSVSGEKLDDGGVGASGHQSRRESFMARIKAIGIAV